MSDLRSKNVDFQNSGLSTIKETPLFSKLQNKAKKSVPEIFLKSIFFMGTLIGLNLLNFFNFFAFKTEKKNSAENRARTAKLRAPIDSVEKNSSKYVV